jgi:hypothetical protein
MIRNREYGGAELKPSRLRVAGAAWPEAVASPRERSGTVRKGGHLDIRLFGHLEVALDGAPFKLATPRKSLQVLAYLYCIGPRQSPGSTWPTCSIPTTKRAPRERSCAQR